MSQNQIVYHSVIPENNRETYGEFDVVDFRCQFPTRAMNLNSVRLTGTFSITDGTNQVVAQRCQLDELVGAHSYFSQIQTFVGGNSIDNILEYPRMVKQIVSATENPADMFSSGNTCELKAPCQAVAETLLRQEGIQSQQAAPVKRDLDFSCKPMVSLNQVVGEKRTLSYSKSGDVRMVLTLARNNAVLFGLDVVEGFTYTLGDLRLEFTSYPDDGDTTTPIVYKRRQGLKQSFASSSAQLNFNFPMMASRVYGSYLPQADENIPAKNNLALAKPPSVSTISFFWNSATNEYISYQLRSQPEIIERYLDAIGENGSNSASLMNLSNNNGYGAGLYLGESVDLMKTKLSVVVESGLLSSQPMLFYLFAEGTAAM